MNRYEKIALWSFGGILAVCTSFHAWINQEESCSYSSLTCFVIQWLMAVVPLLIIAANLFILRRQFPKTCESQNLKWFTVIFLNLAALAYIGFVWSSEEWYRFLVSVIGCAVLSFLYHIAVQLFGLTIKTGGSPFVGLLVVGFFGVFLLDGLVGLSQSIDGYDDDILISRWGFVLGFSIGALMAFYIFRIKKNYFLGKFENKGSPDER